MFILYTIRHSVSGLLGLIKLQIVIIFLLTINGHVSHLNKLIALYVYICSFHMLFLVFLFSLYIWLIFVNPLLDPFIRTYINFKSFYHVTEVLAQTISMQHYPCSLECWPPYNNYKFFFIHIWLYYVVFVHNCGLKKKKKNHILWVKWPLNNIIYQRLYM